MLTSALFAFSCAPALYIPVKNDEKNGVSLAELLKGRELYEGKCGRCHSLYLPEKFNLSEWNFWIDKMRERAKLKEDEKELIIKYISLKAKQ